MRYKIRKTRRNQTEPCHSREASPSDHNLAAVHMTHSWGRPDDGALPEAVYRRLWDKFQAELCTPVFEYQPRTLNCQPGQRPWCFWWFLHGRPIPRPRELVETFCLDAMGVLDGPELEMIYERERHGRHWPRPESGAPFHRCFSWWLFVRQAPRDWTLSEAEQLAAMGALDDQERKLLPERNDYDWTDLFLAYHDILRRDRTDETHKEA